LLYDIDKHFLCNSQFAVQYASFRQLLLLQVYKSVERIRRYLQVYRIVEQILVSHHYVDRIVTSVTENYRLEIHRCINLKHTRDVHSLLTCCRL